MNKCFYVDYVFFIVNFNLVINNKFIVVDFLFNIVS